MNKTEYVRGFEASTRSTEIKIDLIAKEVDSCETTEDLLGIINKFIMLPYEANLELADMKGEYL